MKDEQEYIKDIAEMRSMMERSSKFMFLSGLSGVLAGVFALVGAFVAYKLWGFNPQQTVYDAASPVPQLKNIVILGAVVLVLSLATAFAFSYKKAWKKGERSWNATTRRLLMSMAVPLVTGGLLILVLIDRGLVGLLAPVTLIFYGLALFGASKYTYEEVRSLGLIQIVLGLVAAYYVQYGLLCWAVGFGLVHIVYGIYVHYRYER